MKDKLTWKLLYLTISTNLGSFLYGYDAGIISGSLIFIRKEFDMNSTWQGMAVSAILFFAWLSSTGGGTLANKFGRKKSVIISAVIYTIASGLMSISFDKYTFLASRCLLGIAAGLSSSIVPLYVAESSPTSLRGSLVVVSFLAIVFGQLFASVVAATLNQLMGNNSWRWMLGAACVPSILHIVTCFFIPESPRYLMLCSKGDLARKSLQDLRGTKNVEEEFKSIEEATEKSRHQNSSFRSIFKQVIAQPCLRKALILGILLQIIKQVTGGTPVFYFTGSIIEMSGVHDPNVVLWSAALVNLIFLICTVFGLYLVEKLGRRQLMLSSLGGCVSALIIIALGFYMVQTNSPDISIRSDLSNGACNQFASCYECSRTYECGFCFLESDTGDIINGTCLQGRSRGSASGLCSNGSILHESESDYNIVWTAKFCPSKYSKIILGGLAVFLLFYGPGVGPMPFTINSEIFPLWCRGVCFAVTVGFAWMSNVIMTFSFLPVMEGITQAGAFVMYAVLTTIGLIILCVILPETRGIPLEEIEKVFAPKSMKRVPNISPTIFCEATRTTSFSTSLSNNSVSTHELFEKESRRF